MKKLAFVLVFLSTFVSEAQQLDELKKLLDKSEYDYIIQFREGLAQVKKEDKWGFINTEGKEIIPTKYDEVLELKKDFILLRKGNEVHKFNYKGKILEKKQL